MKKLVVLLVIVVALFACTSCLVEKGGNGKSGEELPDTGNEQIDSNIESENSGDSDIEFSESDTQSHDAETDSNIESESENNYVEPISNGGSFNFN